MIRRLREHGHTAYLAGGCVRDRLLGLTPKDHDVATDATPDVVQQLFKRTRPVGEAFGVVLVYAPPEAAPEAAPEAPPEAAPLVDEHSEEADAERGSASKASGMPPPSGPPSPPAPSSRQSSPFLPIEVATFRTEGPYSDGRRPDAVAFSDARHDAQRRDFTINGLFESPPPHSITQEADAERDSASEASGIRHPPDDAPPQTRTLPDGSLILDHVGGLDDLMTRTLRAIGEPRQRFAEDYLRMLRAVRFTARLDFTLDPATARAIEHNAPKLAGIARERIGDEFRRIFTGPRVGLAVDLLTRLGLAEAALGQPARPTWESATHSSLDNRADYATRLAAWWLDLHPGANPRETRRWRDRLALSNAEHADLRRTLEIAVAMLDAATRWDTLSIAARKRLLADPRGPQALLLHGVALPHWQLRGRRGARDLAAEVRELTQDGIGLAPLPLLDGRALIDAGLKPGPRFKRLLSRAYDAQLEGRLRDPEQALRWALDQPD